MTVSVAPAFDIFSFTSRDDVKNHLALIRAFHSLRTGTGNDAAWRARVANCVAKFKIWASQLALGESPSPVDLEVLMVWHTYLLNPVRYQQDILGLYPALLNLDFANLAVQQVPAREPPTPQPPLFQAHEDEERWDLEDAVHRQASFIDKLSRLGWTETPTDDFVTNCITRYGGFLALMKGGNVHSLVPTLDIDLAWHTHQLKGLKYCKETKELLGHVLNHDDTIPQTQLAKSFDETSAAWKAQFGSTYLAKRAVGASVEPGLVEEAAGCGGDATVNAENAEPVNNEAHAHLVSVESVRVACRICPWVLLGVVVDATANVALAVHAYNACFLVVSSLAKSVCIPVLE